MVVWVCGSIGGLDRVKGMPLVGFAAVGTVLLSTVVGHKLIIPTISLCPSAV